MSNCIHQDTFVMLSSKQIKQVKDIVIDDSVFGADGKAYSVTKIMQYQDIDCIIFKDIIFSVDHFSCLNVKIDNLFGSNNYDFIKSDVIGLFTENEYHIPVLPIELFPYFSYYHDRAPLVIDINF